MKTKIHELNFIFLLFIFIFASPLQAADYYVDKDHVSASDSNAGTDEALPWETITKANTTLVAGDTVYIKAGTYTNYIAPSNSGTDGNRITYQNFGNDTVTIQDAEYGIHLNGDDYITVWGINFTYLDRFMFIENDADNNIIAYCNFDQVRNRDSWAGSRIWKNSDYNWVHHCLFSKYGECTAGGSDNGSVFELGFDDGGASYCSQYNLIEDNTMFHGGHHVLGFHCSYNVLRNNYLHNEAWSRGKGNRTLYMSGLQATAGRNLVENNRFGYAAPPCDAAGVGGASLATSYNIIRYNKYYHNNLYGLGLACYAGSDASYNKIYNNTFFNNADDPDPSYGVRYYGAIQFADWTSSETKYNVIKNNLYYSHVNDNDIVYGVNGASLNDQTFANNFDGDTQGDPLFVNASTTPPADKTDSSLPNLDLQSGSPAIDAGSYLTTITSASASGTSFVVDDAGYFMDGWGIIDGDNIQLFGTAQTSTITNVNYTTNTITVNNNLTWTQGQGISLVYEGAAPDIGAYEVLRGPAPSPPKNLRIID